MFCLVFLFVDRNRGKLISRTGLRSLSKSAKSKKTKHPKKKRSPFREEKSLKSLSKSAKSEKTKHSKKKRSPFREPDSDGSTGSIPLPEEWKTDDIIE